LNITNRKGVLVAIALPLILLAIIVGYLFATVVAENREFPPISLWVLVILLLVAVQIAAGIAVNRGQSTNSRQEGAPTSGLYPQDAKYAGLVYLSGMGALLLCVVVVLVIAVPWFARGSPVVSHLCHYSITDKGNTLCITKAHFMQTYAASELLLGGAIGVGIFVEGILIYRRLFR
jgi:hypothetical protein